MINYDNYWKNKQQENNIVNWRNLELLKVTKLEQIGSVIELGCGKGVTLKAFVDKYNPKKSVGVGISPLSIKEASKLLPKTKFVKLDLDKKLPFKDKTFDLVIMCDILEHTQNPDKVLKEAVRISQYVALKIPIEDCVWTTIGEHIGRKFRPGEKHPSGHLHKWTENKFLDKLSGYNVLESKFLESYHIRKQEYQSSILRKIFYLIEELMRRYCPFCIYRWIYGGHLFILLKSDKVPKRKGVTEHISSRR